MLCANINPAPEFVLANTPDGELHARDSLQKREDTYRKINHMRNGHACIMSIVFIVLFPLGAISIHLPIDKIGFLRNTYLRKKIMALHAPIQMLGFAMMIGAMALGIRIAHDLDKLRDPVQAHVVIGLLVTSTLILFQPIMGFLQHRYYKKTGGRSVFGYAHRWIGRCAIILGIVNNGLGFQLASSDIIVPKSSYIRNFILAGVLVSIWLSLIIYDTFSTRRHGAAAKDVDEGTAKEVKVQA
jgi:Eukaryotic cytochrome b561